MRVRFLRRTRLASGYRSPKLAGLALVYHRVGSPAGNACNQLVPALDTSVFEAQLDHLRKMYHVVAPSELRRTVLARHRREKFPVALTFDDDLPSHAEVVAPALEHAGLPAGFFLCGSALDGGPPFFWWQDLQALVSSGFFEQGGQVSSEVDFALLSGGDTGAIHAVAERIEHLPPERRDRVAAELRAHVETMSAGLEALALRRLATSGFEIGFHTRHHYLLATLDDSRLAVAMAEGRERLEALTGYRLKMIAYPHGKADQRVADAARAAGFELGFTGAASPLLPTSDPLLIGRLDAHAVPAGDFERVVAETLARAWKRDRR